MSSKIFKIRQALLIPFAINTGLLLILLCLSIFFKGSPIERIMLTVIFIPTLIFFLEAANRTATMGEQGIILRKFLRKRDLRWEDITHVGCLIIRKRVYLLLTTTKGFHILSNAYDDFSVLVRNIVDHVGIDKSRCDAIHGDVAAGYFLRKRPRQPGDISDRCPTADIRLRHRLVA